MASSTKKKPDRKKRRDGADGGRRAPSPKLLPPIKGYLPLRVGLPPVDLAVDASRRRRFSTYLYVKEHASRSARNASKSSAEGGGDDDDDVDGGGATLFVANAPSTGPIRTDLFLRALFERQGGEVARVTVAKDIRMTGGGDESGAEAGSFVFTALASSTSPSALFGAMEDGRRQRKGYGKFAHVIFASGNAMRKTLKAMNEEMTSSGPGDEGEGGDEKDGGGEGDGPRAIQLDDEILERLARETAELEQATPASDDDDEEDVQGREGAETNGGPSGILAVAALARRCARRHLPRSALLEKCNAAMEAYEIEEAEAGRRKKDASEEPDEDGFVTVSRGTIPRDNRLEGDAYAGGEDAHRRKGGKRTRKRKAGELTGSSELKDFYRFQLKEGRKNEVHELKKRFEEDLAKVKKMKEERAYRPF